MPTRVKVYPYNEAKLPVGIYTRWEIAANCRHSTTI